MEIFLIVASFVIGFYINKTVEIFSTRRFLKKLKALELERIIITELSKYKTPKEMQAFLDKIPK